MIATIKAEFRKLFTVRSTYIMMILSSFIIAVLCLYFEGFKGVTGSPASTLAPTALKEIISNAAGTSVLFASIIAILFMTHEYRYNTIIYTLTANTRRTKVLLAKVLAAGSFSVVYGLFSAVLALGCYMVGLSLRDASLPPQDFEVFSLFGKVAFYFLGYALFGLIIATIARSVVMAIATLLIFPTTVEPLLGLLLKEESKYLPFTALDSSVGAAMVQDVLSPGRAMVVTCIYLVISLAVMWLLFVRRDAN